MIAKLLPIAFPPIVKDETTAVTTNPVKIKSKLYLEIKIAAIEVAAAPETTPQISPITSQQKLETLGAFFLNFTAIFAPLLF